MKERRERRTVSFAACSRQEIIELPEEESVLKKNRKRIFFIKKNESFPFSFSSSLSRKEAKEANRRVEKGWAMKKKKNQAEAPTTKTADSQTEKRADV